MTAPSESSWSHVSEDPTEASTEDWQITSRPASPPLDVPALGEHDGSDLWRHVKRKGDPASAPTTYSVTQSGVDDDLANEVAALRLYAQLEGRPWVTPKATDSELESLARVDLTTDEEAEDDDDSYISSVATLRDMPSISQNDAARSSSPAPPPDPNLAKNLQDFQVRERTRLLGLLSEDDRSSLLAFFVGEGYTLKMATLLVSEVDGATEANGLTRNGAGVWYRMGRLPPYTEVERTEPNLMAETRNFAPIIEPDMTTSSPSADGDESQPVSSRPTAYLSMYESEDDMTAAEANLDTTKPAEQEQTPHMSMSSAPSTVEPKDPLFWRYSQRRLANVECVPPLSASVDAWRQGKSPAQLGASESKLAQSPTDPADFAAL